MNNITSYIYFAQIEKYYIETLFLSIEAIPNLIQSIGYNVVKPTIKLSKLDGTNGFTINSIDAYDFRGYFVSSAGDVNCDRYDDI